MGQSQKRHASQKSTRAASKRAATEPPLPGVEPTAAAENVRIPVLNPKPHALVAATTKPSLGWFSRLGALRWDNSFNLGVLVSLLLAVSFYFDSLNVVLMSPLNTAVANSILFHEFVLWIIAWVVILAYVDANSSWYRNLKAIQRIALLSFSTILFLGSAAFFDQKRIQAPPDRDVLQTSSFDSISAENTEFRSQGQLSKLWHRASLIEVRTSRPLYALAFDVAQYAMANEEVAVDAQGHPMPNVFALKPRSCALFRSEFEGRIRALERQHLELPSVLPFVSRLRICRAFDVASAITNNITPIKPKHL